MSEDIYVKAKWENNRTLKIQHKVIGHVHVVPNSPRFEVMGYVDAGHDSFSKLQDAKRWVVRCLDGVSAGRTSVLLKVRWEKLIQRFKLTSGSITLGYIYKQEGELKWESYSSSLDDGADFRTLREAKKWLIDQYGGKPLTKEKVS